MDLFQVDQEILSELKKVAKAVHVIPGTETALDLGDVRTFNIVILGALSALLKSEPGLWKEVIGEKVPPKAEKMNQRAFDRGRTLV